MNRWMLTAAALLGAAPSAAQQMPPAGSTPRDFVIPEGATFVLPNGMNVTLVPWGSIPKATVSLVVRVGNINESESEVWLADLTGDMMGEGTAELTAEQLAERTASMGGSLNVGVGLDQTTIGGDVLSEHVPGFVRLVADVAMRPRLPESELERLKNDRVRQVSVARRQPGSLTLERFREVTYGDHPYGRLFPSEDMLRGFTIGQVREFHARNFGAARAHLYVVGRFPEREVEAAVRAAFASWQRGPDPVIDIPEPRTGRDVLTIDRPNAAQSTIYIGLPVVDPSHPDYIALQVTNSLLGGSFGSRITANIREDKGYTYSPSSFVSTRYRDAYWVESADVTTAVTGAALTEIVSEIDRLQGEPPTETELDGIQNYMTGIFVLQNSTRGGITGQLAFLNLHGLGRDYLSNYVSRINSVSAEEISRMARDYLRDEDMLIVVTGDESVILEQLAPFRSLNP